MSVTRRLVGLISPFRRSIAVAVLLSFLTLAASVALMATSAFLISKATLVSDVSGVAIAITSVRLFAILRAVFRYLERLVSHRTTFRILAHLRVWFFSAVEPLAPAGLHQHRSGDLMTRCVADIETLEGFYVRVVVPPIASALAVAFACVLLGNFGGVFGLTLLAFLMLTGVALPLVVRHVGHRHAEASIATRAALNARLVDQVQGTGELLIFDSSNAFADATQRVSARLDNIQQRMALLRGAGNGLSVLFAGLAAISILWLAIPRVTSGEVDGVYLALLPLVAIASFEAVQTLPTALQQLGANQAAGRRLFELIDAPPPVIDPNSPATVPQDVGIVFAGVNFRYPPAEESVLKEVSFSIPVGTCLAVTGPTGSGKSTLVNLLLRFWDVDSGSIAIGGRDLRELAVDDVRGLIGCVPQQIYLFNSTVRDNLLIANPSATDEDIAGVANLACLTQVIQDLPDGYDTMIGENGFLLSGGERQRLAIARAILKNAPILLLDEPTANLDEETELAVIDSLREVIAGRTALIVSHRPAVLVLADHIISMEQGRISASAKPEHANSSLWSNPSNDIEPT